MDRNEFLQHQLDLIVDKQVNPNLDWQDINDFRVDSLGIIEAVDTTRKGAKLLNEYVDAGWTLKPPSSKDGFEFNDSLNDELELRKERMKIQTEKVEMNRNLRELARDEMMVEKIHDAITTLPPLDNPKYIEPERNIRSYLLTIADCHFGIEFKVKDFFGNIVNEYSPEIFKSRMMELYSYVIDTIERENINELNVWLMGDEINGILKLNSQLMQLRYGIVESAILYAEFMATWLNALSEHARIKLQIVRNSNHNQLRICGAPKNAFPDENMGYVINSFLKERLKGNQNIVFVDNPTGLNFAIMSTYAVAGIHGEVKNMAKALNDYSRAYSVPINYLIGGHKHHSKSEEVGVEAEAINVKSVVGVDPYGMSLQKTSNAGANMFVFEQGRGKVLEYTYNFLV